MEREPKSAVVLLSTMVTLAVIGTFSVAYVILRPLFDAVIHALSVLPR